MRRKLLILFCILICNHYSISQEPDAHESGYGFHFGVLNTNLRFSGVNTKKGKSIFSPAFGLAAQAKFSDKLAIYTEVDFTKTGTNYTDSDEERIRITNSFQRITLVYYPVTNVFVTAGPDIGVVWKKGFKEDNANLVKHSIIAENIINCDKSFTLSLCMGVGYGKGKIRFDTRYSHGITNLICNPGISGIDKVTSNSLMISFTYIIPGFRIGPR